MALQFHIVTGSNVPVYRQIIDQVNKAVANGALRPGDQLPSVRALAEQLVINPNTVARAYGDLTHEGVVESHPGKGLFIAERRQILSEGERRRRLAQALDVLLSDIILLDFTTDEIVEMLQRKLADLQVREDTRRKERDRHE